jgi:hypothetical protein
MKRQLLFIGATRFRSPPMAKGLEREAGHNIAWVCDDAVDKHDSKSRWIKN